MATILYLTDTLSSLTISGYVVRTMSLTRGASVVTKSWTCDATSPEAIYDTGTTALVFAFRIGTALTFDTANDPVLNAWGSESNAMANYGPYGFIRLYNNDGTEKDISFIGAGGTVNEWDTSAAARTHTYATFSSSTSAVGDWLVCFPQHGAVGSPGSGYTLNFSYGSGSAGVNGDTYITFSETFVEYSAATSLPPVRHRYHLIRR